MLDLNALDDTHDPLDVYGALLKASGVFTENYQLRGYLATLTTQHTLAALTAAHMWALLDSAASALRRHPHLSEQDRELLRALGQTGELAQSPITNVPEIGVELHEELEAARTVLAALDALTEAQTGSDPHHVSSCQQLLAQAHREYRELVSGHVHAPIGPEPTRPSRWKVR